jgi:hypothetical protein
LPRGFSSMAPTAGKCPADQAMTSAWYF